MVRATLEDAPRFCASDPAEREATEQLPMRSSLGLVGISLLRTTLVELDQYEARTSAVVRGWLLGRRARPLFGVDWKAHWHEPIADVRRRHDIDVDGVDRLLSAWSRD